MYEVNRSIALIRPQAPFTAWLATLPGAEQELIENAVRDCNALLIPPCDDIAEARAFVLQHYQQLFAAELADWCMDESLWPELSAPRFAEWFDVEIHSVLTDLVEEPLEREPFIPLDL